MEEMRVIYKVLVGKFDKKLFVAPRISLESYNKMEFGDCKGAWIGFTWLKRRVIGVIL
jgi:hypothetical protein